MDSPQIVHFDASQPFAPEPRKLEDAGLERRKTILLAEDDKDLRFVMQYTLRAMGYLVVAVEDAYLASAAYRNHPSVDLLLTDYEMPGRTGMELARELTELHPCLPVVFVTGSMLSQDTLNEIGAQRWTYLGKPCRMDVLEATLWQLLNAAKESPRTYFLA